MTNLRQQWVNNQSDKYFFPFIALVFIAIIITGFSPSFYLSEKAFDLPLPIFVHGVIFSIWVLFFFAQTLLISSEKYQLHAKLGKWSVIVLIILIISSIIVAFQGIERNGSRGFGSMIQNIILFTSFFGLGMIYRKRRDWHKRFMVFSIYSALTPAIGRMRFLESLPSYLIMIYLPVILLIVYDLWLMRRINKATIIGVVSTFIFMTIAGLIYNTEWWDNLVT